MSKSKKRGFVSDSANVKQEAARQEQLVEEATRRAAKLAARFRVAADEALEEYDKWGNLCEALEQEPAQLEADRQLRRAKEADLRATRLEVKFHEANIAANAARGKRAALNVAQKQDHRDNEAEQESNPTPPRPAPSQRDLERKFFRAHRADERVLMAHCKHDSAIEQNRAKWDEWERLCEEAKAAGRAWVEPSTEPVPFPYLESRLYTTKWSITAEKPTGDESQTLGEFSSLKKALRYLRKRNREEHCGERIALTAPGGHYYDSLPVYLGKWVVGHVDPGTDEATVIETFYRRKDAISEVRDAIQKGLRPILVAPWIADPCQETQDTAREAATVDA